LTGHRPLQSPVLWAATTSWPWPTGAWPRPPPGEGTCCSWPARPDRQTRLLATVAEAASRRSFGVVRAAAFPGDVEASGGLLLDLASDLRQSGAARLREVGEAMAGRLRELAGVGGRHRQRRLLVQDLADAAGRIGGGDAVLVVLEDLHWADQLSLEVVAHLAARLAGRPLLVAGAYRSDELYPRLPMRHWRARLLTARQAEEVRLPRLTRDQTAALTRALLGQAPRPGSSRPSTTAATASPCTSRSSWPPSRTRPPSPAAARSRPCRCPTPWPTPC